jgi:hypothetical protein
MVAFAFKTGPSQTPTLVGPADMHSSSLGSAKMAPNEREDVAIYLAQITAELATLARGAQFDLLAYFLEMARIEAKGHASTLRSPN